MIKILLWNLLKDLKSFKGLRSQLSRDLSEPNSHIWP